FRRALTDFAGERAASRPGVEDALSLTPMQEGMLFHHLRGGAGADPYVGQVAVELTGEVDVEALSRAWQLAVDTHPALRTEFVWEDVEHPVQVVRRGVVLAVAIHDGKEIAVAEVMAAARAGGFD